MPRGTSILLVEDEPVVRRVMPEMLKARGYNCKAVGNINQAIKIIEEGFFPESAAVDFLVPGGRGPLIDSLENESYGLSGGLLFCKYLLLATGGKCRIVLTTGLNDYRAAAQEAGIWGYLLKPVHDFGAFFDILGEGSLNNREMGQPTLDVNDLIRSRLER